MKPKTIKVSKTARQLHCGQPTEGYDCHSLNGCYIGYFFEVGGHWAYHANDDWADHDAESSRHMALRWEEIAEFLDHLNAGGPPK